MIEGKKIITEETYRAIPSLSSSDLRLFSIDRKKFYKTKVLLEERDEEYSKALLIGSISHCLLLEPENFESKFFLSVCEKPPTGMLLTFTESLYKHTIACMDEEGVVTREFSELAQLAYEESGYKITLEAVLKKFAGEGERYYYQLREAKTRGLEVVCVDDLAIANKIVQIIKEDEFVGPIFSDELEGLNEVKVESFDLDGIEMKAMLDRIIIDRKNKTIQLYDLKVVFDNQNFYREYWLKKKAYIQAFVYWRALMAGTLDLGFNYADYEILPPIFIAADSGCHYQPLLYTMKVSDLDKAEYGFMESGRFYEGVSTILSEIKFCKENNIWNISKKAYENKGVVELAFN